ncbi:MAG: hypothetical protein CM15mP54_15140 [Paracoccaceae bacterium]|nr:MAG: hypothetical protein CM15mP54_15140 [Paracoccaceae bacterium]
MLLLQILEMTQYTLKGNDTITTGSGNDTVYLGNGTYTVDLGAGMIKFI